MTSDDNAPDLRGEYPEGAVVRVADMGPVERAYAEAEHENCESEPKGHPLSDHEPWSGGDLDGVETWDSFTARLARHGLALTLDATPSSEPSVEPGPTCACDPKHGAGEFNASCQKANSAGVGYCFDHPGSACWGPEWDDVVAAIPLDAYPLAAHLPPEPSVEPGLDVAWKAGIDPCPACKAIHTFHKGRR